MRARPLTGHSATGLKEAMVAPLNKTSVVAPGSSTVTVCARLVAILQGASTLSRRATISICSGALSPYLRVLVISKVALSLSGESVPSDTCTDRYDLASALKSSPASLSIQLGSVESARPSIAAASPTFPFRIASQ